MGASNTSSTFDLMPFVRLETPGCPDIIAQMAIYRAVVEFCQRTEIWQGWHNTFTGVSPTVGVFPEQYVDANATGYLYTSSGHYAFVYPHSDTTAWSTARILRIKRMELVETGQVIQETNEAKISELAGANWRDVVGFPPKYFIPDPAQLGTHVNSTRIYPKPATDQADTIRIKFVAIPPDSADGNIVLPNFLYDQFAEAFTYGALRNLLRIPGKDWTDPMRAAAYSAEFEKEISRATGMSKRGGDGRNEVRRTVRYGGY